VQSADITLAPEVGVKTEWDDNVDMSRSQERSDFLATFIPALSVDAATERLNLNSRAAISLLRYARDEERNTEYLSLAANGAYRVHERLRISAHGNLVEDEALQAELEETGLIVRGFDRRRYGGGAGLLYDLTPASTLGLDGSHQRTQYSGGGYDDNTQDSLSLSYRQTLSDEVNSFLVQTYFSDYESGRSESQNQSLSMGWTRDWTRSLMSQAMLGVRRTKSEYTLLQQSVIFDPALPPRTPFRLAASEVKQKETNWGGVGDISVTWKGETHSMSVGYNRDMGFSAEGESIVRDRLHWTVNHSFTDRLRAGFSTALSHSKSAGDRSRTDAWYFSGTPSLTWRITEDYTLEGGYSYSRSREKASVDGQEADRHRIWVSLTMRFPRKW
jgi:hypothetical protein